jgi:hypothetical protein
VREIYLAEFEQCETNCSVCEDHFSRVTEIELLEKRKTIRDEFESMIDIDGV